MTRGAETKTRTAKRFVGRVTLVLAFFSLIAMALAARAVHLQVLNTEFLNQQADTRHLRRERISAHRGTITDRNGEPLAISTPVDSIWANPKELAPAVDEVPRLARALGLDPQLLMRRITRSMDKEFLYLKRHLSPEQARKVLGLARGDGRADVDPRLLLFTFLGICQHWFQDRHHVLTHLGPDIPDEIIDDKYLRDAIKIFFEGVLPR